MHFGLPQLLILMTKFLFRSIKHCSIKQVGRPFLNFAANLYSCMHSMIPAQVHMNDWGTLSTISREMSSADRPVAFGSTVSYSDGPEARSDPNSKSSPPPIRLWALSMHMCILGLVSPSVTTRKPPSSALMRSALYCENGEPNAYEHACI